MQRGLYIMVLALFVFPCRSQTIVINEVAYTNDNILADNEGDSPDWFELYNATDHAVNLYGYQVTDDTGKTAYWKFPHYILEAGKYLVVFASGKNIARDAEFHTSFRLRNMKETLYLFNAGEQLIDVAYPVCIPAGYSLGRKPDGSGSFIVALPTPGITNNYSAPVTVDYVRDTLMVSSSSGFFDAPLTVTLTNSRPENVIRYTLDGEVPEEESPAYDQPLLLRDLTPEENRFANIPETVIEPGNKIFKANILRAVVFSNGCPASNEISNTYFINEAMKGRYHVPIVSLITEEDNLFDDETGIYVHGRYRNFDQHGGNWERITHIEIFDSTGNQVIDQDGGMRIHGRGSRRSPQKSLRLYADPEYGKEYFEYPFFRQKPALGRFKVLLLRTTGGTLGPLFKEELCNYLVQDMHTDYPAGETAILFINGEYWGIYNLMERQNRYFIEDNFQVSDTDVDIVAYDREVIAEEGTLDEYNQLVMQLQNADPASEGFYREMEGRMDLNNLIDYYIAQLYFANTDWPLSNVELWKLKNDTAKWRYFFFDSDASMVWLNEDHLTEYNNDIEELQRYPEFCTVILKTLMNNDLFRTRFFRKYHDHMNTTFSTDRVWEAIDRFERKYAPLVPEHIYRWHNPADYAKWEEHVDWLRSFALQRPLYIAEQLLRNFGKPFIIYPNPGRGDFTVELVVPAESVTIRVLAVSGELLGYRTFTNVQGTSVPVSIGLPPGLYVLQVITNDLLYSDKLVIQ